MITTSTMKAHSDAFEAEYLDLVPVVEDLRDTGHSLQTKALIHPLRFQFHDEEQIERCQAALGPNFERFRKFALELHPDKTRLIEFGRYAAANRKRRGQGKPESFDFLGFTHVCDRSSKGRFIVLRQTIAKRMRAKLAEIKLELRRRLHHSTPSVGRWLRSVLQGHFQYYGVPRNQRKLAAFKCHVYCLWFRTLRRRSQRHRITGERMNRLAAKWLPPVRNYRPYPEQRLHVTTCGRSLVR